MTEKIPPDIIQDLKKAATLRQRATSDYEKCLECTKLMSELHGRLEGAGWDNTSDKVMRILLDCNPKPGSQCDKATRIEEKIKKI